jgi:hypothetical protein
MWYSSDIWEPQVLKFITNYNYVALVRKRTIPNERQPLVGKVSAKFADRVYCVVSATDPHGR